jgi:hypothetical protein
MRQLDEIKRLETELPTRDAVLAMVHPLLPPLRELSPAEVDTFQSVLNYGQLQAVLDRSPLTDLETTGALVALLQRGYIAVSE